MRVSNPLHWIIVVGIVLRIVLWCFQVTPAGDDGERYYTESQNLVEHGVFSTDSGSHPHPTAHDLPLWPYTMAGILWLTDSKSATIRLSGILNISLMLGAVLFMLSLLRRPPFHASTRGKVLATAVILFLPDSIPYSLFHMPDPMALFFLCGAMAFFFRGIYGSRKWLMLSAAFFGLAILAKPICLPIAMAFFTSLLFLLRTSFLRRVGWLSLSCALLGMILLPWVLRNQKAFGRAGLTTISGTNLYSCNWGWMVQTWPTQKRSEAQRQNKIIETQVKSFDLMSRSNILGRYAKEQILTHLPEYAYFTLLRHPRLYLGTGTVALLRYLGLEGPCRALSGINPDGTPTEDFTTLDYAMGWGAQMGGFLLLAINYAIILVGLFFGIRDALRSRSLLSQQSVSLGVALGGIILLAIVIGPVVATRYRFLMIPFFAALASFIPCATAHPVKLREDAKQHTCTTR